MGLKRLKPQQERQSIRDEITKSSQRIKQLENERKQINTQKHADNLEKMSLEVQRQQHEAELSQIAKQVQKKEEQYNFEKQKIESVQTDFTEIKIVQNRDNKYMVGWVILLTEPSSLSERFSAAPSRRNVAMGKGTSREHTLKDPLAGNGIILELHLNVSKLEESL